MKVYVKGSGTGIDLTQRDYLGEGGEGVVYVRGKTAYKVYHDHNKMIPTGKFQELAAIQDPRVIRPQSLLVNDKGTNIGYTMPFIDGGHPLCKLFPRSFREREGVTQQHILDLVSKMQGSISNVHKAGVLIVDCNEMNFLAAKDFGNVYLIDADSYQTPSYPATAIMDSIRDWSIKGMGWSQLSDWYSFGILTFQMFVGIHPFRGKYHGPKMEFRTKLPTDADDDSFAITRRRMQAGISVLHPDVGIPGSAYPLTSIPSGYRQWFEALFAQGKRCPPPTSSGTFTMVLVPTITTPTGVTVDMFDLFPGWAPLSAITGFFASPVVGGAAVISTLAEVYYDRQTVPVPEQQVQVCGFSPRAGRAVVGSLQGNKLSLYNVTDRASVPFALSVLDTSCYDGRIYVRTAEQIHEVILTDAGSQVIASTQVVANVMPYATKLFSGVALQSMLGSVFASLFVRPGSAQQVRIPELDKYRVIDAKFDHGVLMVIGEKAGKYDRLVFRFSPEGAYDTRIIKGIPGTYQTNFVTLDTGVCVCLNEEEKLELFSNRKDSPAIKIVEDKTVTGDLTLAKHAGSLVAFRGNKILKLKMK